MVLYFADTNNWDVVEVQGEPWPGRDCHGNRCYDNTHFKTRQEAVDKLMSESNAWMILCGRDLARKERDLADAKGFAAESMKVWTMLRERDWSK